MRTLWIVKKKTHSSESEPAFLVIFFVGGGISLGYKPIFGPPRDLNPLLLPISPPPFINVASMQNHTQILEEQYCIRGRGRGFVLYETDELPAQLGRLCFS